MSESKFRREVKHYLIALTKELSFQLKKLIDYNYPNEVKSIKFEIFPDMFTEGFPVRAFFMDSDNSEHFILEDGVVKYPAPITPELLNIQYVYPDWFENQYLENAQDLDTRTISSEEMIKWFHELWNNSGGGEFHLEATIASHDSLNYFDLKDGNWKDVRNAYKKAIHNKTKRRIRTHQRSTQNGKIDLNDAHKVLATFGISKPTKTYERWVKDYGFDLDDFEEVLNESNFIYWFDWRGELSTFLEYLKNILNEFEIDTSYTMDYSSTLQKGTFSSGVNVVEVEYNASEENFIENVVKKIQKILSEKIEIRQSTNNEGVDTWGVAILTQDEWSLVESVAKTFVDNHWIKLH